ncbi:MAG: restriction endonuclease [Gordonia polyisoprenivorans]|nr:restriction endonuclease [Gordonia polyisoprenivorans]
MYIRDATAAEQNAAERMRELGFTDARVTPGGADNGIDVIAANALAQVKWRGAQVPRADIQRLFGARGHRQDVALLFFAASGFSKAAVECADELGVMLFSYDPDGSITPHGRHAAAHQLPAASAPAAEPREPSFVVEFPTTRWVWNAGDGTRLLAAAAWLLTLAAAAAAIRGIAAGRPLEVVVDLALVAVFVCVIYGALRRLKRLREIDKSEAS